ncbi:hypothetical protein JXM83_01035 [Candidatus Woesearchaeota archaeon]|nr:hypothetical protein [Candidatus Woesearchaeota archaeon]
MISRKIKSDVVKIGALFDFYDELANRKLKDKAELSVVKEKMMFTRKQIIEYCIDIKKNVKEFEERL